MKELISLLDTALSANLSKRQWAVFAAVLRQTVGYRKTCDDLSANRLAQLTGIQRNHVWQAKNELVAMGLLISQPGRYGEILSLSSLFSPSTGLPSSPSIAPELGGEMSQFGPESVPNWDTTLRNQTYSNHNTTTQPVEPPTEPEPVEPMQPESVVVVVEEKLSHVKVASDLNEGMRWPKALEAGLQPMAASLLCGLSVDTAQSVLDVFGLALEAQAVRKPIGYLRALIRAARAGELDTTDLTIRQQQQRPPAPASTSSAPTSPAPSSPTHRSHSEQVAEWQWVQQMAALQGMAVEVVAAQLGVKRPAALTPSPKGDAAP